MQWQKVLAVLLVVAAIALALAARAAAVASRSAQGRGGPGRPLAVGGRVGDEDKVAAAVHWDGPAACYPAGMVAEALSFVRRLIRETQNYGWPGAGEWRRLAAEAARLSEAHSVPIGVEQLASMRNMEVAFGSRVGGVRAMRRGPQLAEAVARGEPVVSVAARHGLPPLAVLRQVLLEAGQGPEAVRRMIAEPARLPPALAREAPAIFEADLDSRPNATLIRERAQAYEDAVGDHLRVLGLRFRKEADLRRDAGPGAPTPDFLLDERALFDGRPVCWVDAKAYAAVDSKLVLGGLKKQALKYAARYGPGAFVFAGGVMCGSRLADTGVLLLDGSHIKARPKATKS